MDPTLPFATGADRLRLLYRLPLRGDESRLLVIGSHDDAARAFDLRGRAGGVQVAAPGAALPGAGFDAIALPGSLSGGRTSSALPPRLMLMRAREALRPGGLLVGHIEPPASVHHLASMLRGRRSCPAWHVWRDVGSGPACLRSLAQAGFEGAECYHVEPHIGAPMALIPIEARAARRHFMRAIGRNRALYSTCGFALRLALAGLSLGGLLQPQVFFWARRPC